jgi:hypothetical protein
MRSAATLALVRGPLFKLTIACAMAGFAACAIAACVGDDPAGSPGGGDAGPLRGTEGGECFEDNTCKVGLDCKSGRCVLLDSGGGFDGGFDGGVDGRVVDSSALDADADGGLPPCADPAPSLIEDGGFRCGDGGPICKAGTQTCCPTSSNPLTCVDRDAEASCLSGIKIQCVNSESCEPTKPHCCLKVPSRTASCTATTGSGAECSAQPCADTAGGIELCTADGTSCPMGKACKTLLVTVAGLATSKFGSCQ